MSRAAQVHGILQKMTRFDILGFQVILWVSPIDWSAIAPNDTVGSQSIAHAEPGPLTEQNQQK